MKVQNPHDKFFKETFGNVEIAKDFLNNYLPENIIQIVDLETIEPQKDSFINQELEEGFSDLLFKVDINTREGYIYFLFEHKSYVSKNIAFQLLKYMIEIWEAKIKKEKTDELPIIIPLVIYNGRDDWNIRTSLGEMITGYVELPKDIQEFIPDYKYILYDISRYTDEEIKGEALIRIALTIMRDILTKQGESLLRSIQISMDYLQEITDKQTGIEYFETLMRYVFSAGKDLSKANVDGIIRQVGNTYPEGSETIMTLAEIFRQEGIEKGLEEGLEKGETKALEKTAVKLLTRRFGPLSKELRSGISGLDAINLEVIIDNIFEYESLEDVEKYIW